MGAVRRFFATVLCLLLLSGCAGSLSSMEYPLSAGQPPLSASGSSGAPSETERVQWLQNRYIQSLVAETAARLSETATNDAERIQAVYEFIVSGVTYTEPLGLDCWRYRGEQTQPAPPFLETRALSPLLFGAGWCEDSAAATVLLLQAMGLNALYLPGMTVSVERVYIEHAWVLVELDGAWYHIDPQLERNVLRSNRLTYRYFLKSDDEMRADHLWGESWIAYGKSGEQALTPEQIDEIWAHHIPPACTATYPTPAPREIALAPPPQPTEIQALLAEERQEFEQEHGPLPPLRLNLAPPVFGEASAPPWEDNVGAMADPSPQPELTAEHVTLYEAFGRVAGQYLLGQATPVAPPLSHADFSAVWLDWYNAHPQYDWAAPITALNTRGEVSSFRLETDAHLTPEVLQTRQQEIDVAAAALLENLPEDEFERAYAIHDRLINASYYAYAPGAADVKNIYGVLVKQRGVCDGLSRAYQYLAQLAGMECLYVYGTTPWGTPHTWNAIKLAGEWYYVDVTWDLSRGGSNLLHAYLLASWEDISREHIPAPELAGRLPEITGTSGNYYIRRGYAAQNPRDNPYLLAAAFVAQLDNQEYTESRRQAFTEIKVLADEASFQITKNYTADYIFTIIECINEIAESRGLSWRVDKSGAAVVNYDEAAQVITALLYVKKLR